MGAMEGIPQTVLSFGFLMALGSTAAAVEPVLPRLQVLVYDSAGLP